MTRRNKCTACRKAKIRCDDSFSRCFNCIRLDKICIRGQHKKTDFRFVEVRGELVRAANKSTNSERPEPVQDSSTTQDTRAEQQRCGIVLTQPKRTNPPPEPKISRADFFWPYCEGSRLFDRWTSTTRDYINHVDVYGGWSTYVPHYLGRSDALQKSVRCFLESRQAVANPTEANLRVLRLSNVDAVRSIRHTLEGSRSLRGDILIAIQLLYVVESSLLHSPVAFAFHAEGLITLLKEHKKSLPDLDDQERLISRIMFQSTFATGLVPALFAGTDHQFDDPEWLATPLEPRPIPGITSNTTQQAYTVLVHSFIRVPRLARLLRLLKTSLDDANVESEAIGLAQQLLADSLSADFFCEAETSGELRLEPTVLLETCEAVPKSYRFGSTRLFAFLATYWACRLFICGLVQALIIARPFASGLFDMGSVFDEDQHLATDALMAAQQTFMASEMTPRRNNEMRLLMLVQAGFGSWCRLERRLKASEEISMPAGLEQAKKKKQSCLDMANRLLIGSQASPTTEAQLEAIIALISGGPLFA